eukprot:9347331-Pyramimonas_sp.AAC.1
MGCAGLARGRGGDRLGLDLPGGVVDPGLGRPQGRDRPSGRGGSQPGVRGELATHGLRHVEIPVEHRTHLRGALGVGGQAK